MFRTIDHRAARREFAAHGFTERQLRALGSSDYLCHGGSLHEGSLRLDHGEVPWGAERAEPARIGGYIIEGDLTIDGNLVNGEQDFGPALIVLGTLRARNITIAGAPLLVRGDLLVEELFHGYYNHGSLTVLGGLQARVFLASDYFGEIAGEVRAEVLDAGHCRGAFPRCSRGSQELLVAAAHAENPEYYAEDDEDEGCDEPEFIVDDGKLFSLLELGQPALLGGHATSPVKLLRRS